jgi:hypothetical protein
MFIGTSVRQDYQEGRRLLQNMKVDGRKILYILAPAGNSLVAGSIEYAQ